MSSPQRPTVQSRSAPSRMTLLMHGIMDVTVIVLFTLLAMASLHRYIESHSLQAFGVLGVNTLFLTLFLTRRPAKEETSSPALWALAFAGSAGPFLMRPAAPAAGPPVGAVIELMGLAMLIVALLSLRRSFAVIPGNRGIQRGGMYRLVRHPVYLSELTILLGALLANPTALNAGVWICECALQLARARAEERFLAADPLYVDYCARVRYRLIPRVI